MFISRSGIQHLHLAVLSVGLCAVAAWGPEAKHRLGEMATSRFVPFPDRDRQVAILRRAVSDRSLISLDKAQTQRDVGKLGVLSSPARGKPYEEFWGNGFDEAWVYEVCGTDELHLLFRNGLVAQVGLIYLE